MIINVIDYGMNIAEAVNAPRVHHQWLPDELRVEEGIGAKTIKRLKRMGHKVRVKGKMGAASSILIDSEGGNLYGAADPRRDGLAVGY